MPLLGPVQMLLAQMMPFKVVSAFSSTFPLDRLIHADGRLDPPNFRVDCRFSLSQVVPTSPSYDAITNDSATLLQFFGAPLFEPQILLVLFSEY